MKEILVVAALAVVSHACADNLYTREGSVYRNVKLVSADPERMLIVHDGGGCQVRHADLKPDSLSPGLRQQIERLLVEHAEHVERREELRLAKAEFEQRQREKGLIEFEGAWMAPTEREQILLMREKQRLERERAAVELARQKEELRKKKLETDRARYLLDAESDGYRYVKSYPVYYSYRPDHCDKPVVDPNDCKVYGYVPRLRQQTYPSTCNTYNSGPFYNNRSTSAALKPFNR